MDKVRSYTCLMVFATEDQRKLGDTGIVSAVVKMFVEAIRMKALGPMRIDTLSCPVPGGLAISANQPLETSIASLDTWTEFNTIVFLVHSCQDFLDLCPNAIKETEEFLGASLVQAFYSDLSVQAGRFDPTAIKQWSLDLDTRSWTPYRCVPAASGVL